MKANPNNCRTCDHFTDNPDGGWCYMFRDQPQAVCHQHTEISVGDKIKHLINSPAPRARRQ